MVMTDGPKAHDQTTQYLSDGAAETGKATEAVFTL